MSAELSAEQLTLRYIMFSHMHYEGMSNMGAIKCGEYNTHDAQWRKDRGCDALDLS